jgi:hypothetical protein
MSGSVGCVSLSELGSVSEVLLHKPPADNTSRPNPHRLSKLLKRRNCRQHSDITGLWILRRRQIPGFEPSAPKTRRVHRSDTHSRAGVGSLMTDRVLA